jgi:hypothetical protein
MKRKLKNALLICLSLLLGAGMLFVQPAAAQENRPLLYVADYYVEGGGKNVDPYTPFTLVFTLGNNGVEGAHARNILISFAGEDFSSLDGGVSATHEVDAENKGNETLRHRFKVSDMSSWKYSGVINASISYTNYDGTASYTEAFTFYLGINQQPVGPTRTPTAPAAAQKPLMVVKSYLTDLDPLEPGSTFKLKLFVTNLGASTASAVSLVYGGGVTTTPGDIGGTPQPGGGVTVSGSDLTNFAPLGQSNIAQIGDVAVGSTVEATQDFVVNVTTQPGAYPFKISFVYSDPKGNRMVDDQVITLLVFSLPKLEFSFYRQPDFLNVGQEGQLPIQVTNISKKSAVLGNLTVTTPSGTLNNNTAMIGNLEPGGYYTLDSTFIPEMAGMIPLNFSIRYTDDFNQLRTFEGTLEVEVQEAIPMPEGELVPLLDGKGNVVLDEKGNPVMVPAGGQGGMNGGNVSPTPQQNLNFFQKVWNAIKSFFGINPSNETPQMEAPTESQPGILPKGL